MARARNIKPGFFKNDQLAECGSVCMVLFAGLWSIADFNGNMEYRPKRIKIETIPYFDESIEDCIDVLEKAGFVRRYKVNGAEYLHICGFQKHQNPHKNERDAGTSVPKPTKDGIKTEQVPSSDGSDPADSGFLIPDSLSLNPDIKDLSVSNETNDANDPPIDPQPIKRRNPQPKKEYDWTLFNEFWETYPRNVKKQAASKAWQKLNPDRKLLDQMINNMRQRVKFGEWQQDRMRFIPHPSTYLNQRMWEDTIDDMRTQDEQAIRH